MAGLYMVTQDGRPLRRGLSRAEAERGAAELARGYESHRPSSKRRVAEFDVKPDVEMHKQEDAAYKLWKENR